MNYNRILLGRVLLVILGVAIGFVTGTGTAHARGADARDHHGRREMTSAPVSVTLNRFGRISPGGGSGLKFNIRDAEINSPKSVRFSANGMKMYINSLEGAQTLVYSWPDLVKQKTITHNFGAGDAALFGGETTVFNYPYYQGRKEPNIFRGKPVESELSHGGRYLWVPYYRRDFDPSGQSPSAVAIVDTTVDEIVRVMPTGPIPKYVAVSPDDRYVAVTHWGDNTIGLIDTSSDDPWAWRYVAHLTVESRLSQAGKGGTDRDSTCGFCLRGSVFTPDGRYLLVARMGGGGIAGFDVSSGEYLGSVMNVAATPRHLVISKDGQTLYASSNSAGAVSAVPLGHLLNELERANGKRIAGPAWRSVHVGHGARTLDISEDGQFLFVAVNHSSEVAVVFAPAMKVIARHKVDAYAVGLALAPDGTAVVLTAQGRSGRGGGNSVNLISIDARWAPILTQR